MQRTFILSAAIPSFSVELTFTPSSIYVLNNTDKSVYFSIGGTGVPSATFFNREVLPTVLGIPQNIALPNNSYQFAAFLPTPTDPTKTVTVIFQGTSDPYSNRLPYPFNAIRGGIGSAFNLAMDLGSKLMGGGTLLHYKEYRLNALNPTQSVQLEFDADEIFILNNTNAVLNMSFGGTQLPNPTFNDIGIPQKSYSMLQPHGGSQFGLSLNNPTQKDCFVIFAFGYADEYAMLKDWGFQRWGGLFPGWIYYFEPSNVVSANFTFVVS